MSSTPKAIQILLPSGEPHGIRIAEITTRIVQVIEVPRSLLADFLAMEQSCQVGLCAFWEEVGNDDRRGHVDHITKSVRWLQPWFVLVHSQDGMRSLHHD